MWQYNYTDELYHAGVKGMKWGHRKAPETSSDKKRSDANTQSKSQTTNDKSKKGLKIALGIGAVAVTAVAVGVAAKYGKAAFDKMKINSISPEPKAMGLSKNRMKRTTNPGYFLKKYGFPLKELGSKLSEIGSQ